MTTAIVSTTKKHKYSMGTPDGGGNKMIVVCGEITIISGTANTTETGPEFDLSADIPNLEGCLIQGDSGHIVQYNYADKKIEIYTRAWVSTTDFAGPLDDAGTVTTLAFLVFKFYAWGF